MVELAFLEAIEGLLTNQASLVPAPKSVGVTEPADKGSLPAIVLALGSASRPGAGLGDRNRLMKGALPWSVTIDLANPTLPAIGGEPPVDLLSADRLQLTLPHGGLVKADGSEGPLESGDLSLTVAGQQQAVVTVATEGGQVSAQPDIGLLEFGAALPTQGLVEATYHVGQWEQRIVFIKGTLRVDVLAVPVAEVRTLSDGVARAVQSAGATIKGLNRIDLTELSSIGSPDLPITKVRGREMRFSFEYQFAVNRPESSGGVIGRIPITSRLALSDDGSQVGGVETTVVE